MHPVFLQIGPFALRYYSLMIILAVILASLFGIREAKRRGLDPNKLLDFILYTVVFGIVGARIYYVIFELGNYTSRYPWKAGDLIQGPGGWFASLNGTLPYEFFAIWHGGLAIHGGLIGGIITAIILSKRWKLDFWTMCDTMAPFIILGQACGRIGNLMNGDAHGTRTDLPWGLMFPDNTPAAQDMITRFGTNCPVHPTMIYEFIWNLTGFFILYKLRLKKWASGVIICSYFIYYSIGRFFIEMFRGDSLMFGPMKMAQFIGVCIILTAIGVIIYRVESAKKAKESVINPEPVKKIASE